MNSDQKGINLKSKIASLYAYMANRLHIKKSPKLILTNDETNSKKLFGYTAYYDKDTKTVRVYLTNRHPSDIMRSFAHEIIHHWQNERGQLGGQETETQKHYTQNDPHMRKKEMEAYLLGNILFRDWQDEQRYGSPEKEPFLVALNENVAITDPTKLKTIIRQVMEKLVANNIIATYNRDLSSGQMKAPDFIEEFSHRIFSELQSQIQRINDKGNWENQPNMVS